ncbi:MAG: hypothetical protein IPL96_03790 [Holophagaceae bacterium]|nr:hypothetical protein [Holophagaceae bacterium]
MLLLTVLLGAQLGLAWLHGRMLHRQHAQLLALRDDLQGLAEAIDSAWEDAPAEEGSLAPASRPALRRLHRRSVAGAAAGRLRLAGYRPQEEPAPEQDPAAKELEAARKSGEKAVKDAKVAQKQLSFTAAAERANRVEKIDNASRGFMWATLVAAVVLIGGYSLRGYLRRRG